MKRIQIPEQIFRPSFGGGGLSDKPVVQVISAFNPCVWKDKNKVRNQELRKGYMLKKKKETVHCPKRLVAIGQDNG